MSPVLHFSRHYVEMVVAMFAGMLVLGAPVALALGADLLGDVHDAMLVQHVVMFPAMLGVMLLRPSEYAGHAHERVAA